MDEVKVLRKLAERSGPMVLATVIRTKGSTPRKTGARMLLAPGRVLAGTVGGGCGEGEVIEAAQALFRGAGPKVVRVDLTDEMTSWSPAVCGGIMDVFVERADQSRGEEAAAQSNRQGEEASGLAAATRRDSLEGA